MEIDHLFRFSSKIIHLEIMKRIKIENRWQYFVMLTVFNNSIFLIEAIGLHAKKVFIVTISLLLLQTEQKAFSRSRDHI